MADMDFDKLFSADADKFTDYILRNPDALDKFVNDKVPKETVNAWDKKKKEKPQKPSPSYHLKYLKADYKKTENCKSHQTSTYVNKDLVLRRSATFDVDLIFKNRGYDATKDKIVMEFSIGKTPAEISGTKLRLIPGTSMKKETWGCQLVTHNDAAKTVSLKFNIPNDAIIGRYLLTCEITTKVSQGSTTRRYVMPDVLVVFNPFIADDDVYMSDEVQRNEYVLNESGLIYAGSTNKIEKMAWTFGQFEKDILDIVFRLINEDTSMKSNAVKSLKLHNSPVFVSRVLSAMINSNNDNGVLVGNWSSDFSGGVSPTSWSGSPKILRQWNKSGPVKFGQCWVYSGIMTCALRALGIPARTITNFNSAHDTEYNMSLDKFFYADGTTCTMVGGNDSIWNFHVWNEAHMKRVDLGSGYDGWQAVDATPQEVSDKIFQCGPSPLTAIKNGEVNIGYDTDFLFGEVNADECSFQVDEMDKIVKMIKRDTRKCGHHISTKTPGKNERLDVTNLYKFNEGTAEERAAFNKAQLRGRLPKWHNQFAVQKEGKINITIVPKSTKVRTGQPLAFTVKVMNTTDAAIDSKITSRIESMLYTGKRKSGVKELVKSQVLKAKETVEFEIVAEFKEYGFVVTPSRSFRCMVTVRNQKTDDLYMDSIKTSIKHPKVVALTAPTEAIKQGKFTIRYEVVNPFPISMSNCKLTLEGLGIDGEASFSQPIVSNGKMSGVINGTATRKGKVDIVCNFESKELVSIKAKSQIQVN